MRSQSGLSTGKFPETESDSHAHRQNVLTLAGQIVRDPKCGQYYELVRILRLVRLFPEPVQFAIVADLLTVALRELSAEQTEHIACERKMLFSV